MARKDPREITFKPGSHPDRFERAANPDKHGMSEPIPVKDFPMHHLPKFGNGSGWARDDGSLAKKYKLVKRKDEQGRIVSVQLAGYAEPKFDQSISQGVYDHFSGRECVVLATSRNIEMDHKDGFKLAFRPIKSFDEFQPMSKAVNDAKRTHCRKCKENHDRFDAKRLGYAVSVFAGTLEYEGTCVGCYWHDPIAFNREVTKGDG